MCRRCGRFYSRAYARVNANVYNFFRIWYVLYFPGCPYISCVSWVSTCAMSLGMITFQFSVLLPLVNTIPFSINRCGFNLISSLCFSLAIHASTSCRYPIVFNPLLGSGLYFTPRIVAMVIVLQYFPSFE